MPARIGDSQLRTLTERLRPGTALTDTSVLEVLAAVADEEGATPARVEELQRALARPGLTRQEQLELAKAGLSDQERGDVAALLDRATLPMSPGARNFLEALVGRAALQPGGGALQLDASMARGLSGTARAGDVIEAINLSTAPAGRLHLTDTMEVARADASGRFTGTLPGVREGDLVRVRTRSADGSQVSDWFTVAATGLSRYDEHNAVVNLERLDLAAQADGTIAVLHNTKRPVSEPGALLRFTNTRTGEETDVTVTDAGSLPEGFALKGKAGDTFAVAVSDRRNNDDFLEFDGTLTVASAEAVAHKGVDLPDPKAVSDDTHADGTPKYQLRRFTGPLFVDGAKPTDVRQGAIGNCYFAAGMAALAATHPEVVEQMVKKNDDGTYTVRFLKPRATPEPVEVTVDGDLYARSWGGALYGSTLGGSTAADKMELWFSVVEKAYAQWKGSYDTIGHGGLAGEVMGEVLGRRHTTTWVAPGRADQVYRVLEQAQASRAPATAGTFAADGSARYTNTGVYANHAYTVLGVETVDGERRVKLRNPWGQSEAGNDGANDGVFALPLEQFVKLFQSIDVVGA